MWYPTFGKIKIFYNKGWFPSDFSFSSYKVIEPIWTKFDQGVTLDKICEFKSDTFRKVFIPKVYFKKLTQAE